MEGLWKTHAPSDLPVYPEVPYAFFGFHPELPRTFHLLDVRYPQVYRTQPLGASRKLSGGYGMSQLRKKLDCQANLCGVDTAPRDQVGPKPRMDRNVNGKET